MSRFRSSGGGGGGGFSPPKRSRNRQKGGLDEEALEEIREAFNLFDTENSGLRDDFMRLCETRVDMVGK